MQTRKTWKETFMEMTKIMAKRSPDPNTQVGAMIINADNIIVGAGYNGLPRGCVHHVFPNTRPEKYDYFVHAEANAILNATQSNLKDCCLYTTLSPCQECAKLIIQKGIKTVYYSEYRLYPATVRMFEHCNIKMEKIECN